MNEIITDQKIDAAHETRPVGTISISIVVSVLTVSLISLAKWFIFPEATPTPNTVDKQISASDVLSKKAITNIVRDTSEIVVNIETVTSIPVPKHSSSLSSFRHLKFCRMPAVSQKKPPSKDLILDVYGAGSGIIISKDGYILTNGHVVQEAEEISVTLSDGQRFEGKFVGRDNFSDLAVLKVNATNLPTAKFGSSSKLQTGDWAVAIGNPLGLSNSVSFGIIRPG